MGSGRGPRRCGGGIGGVNDSDVVIEMGRGCERIKVYDELWDLRVVDSRL